jgi:hypothetical protein
MPIWAGTMMRGFRTLIVMSAVATACGGATNTKTEPATGGGVGDAGSLGVGGDGEPSVATCPTDLPMAGKPCTVGLRCSYGDDPRSNCRDRFSCSEGSWIAEERANCPLLAECSSLPTVPKGGEACSTAGEACTNGPGQCSCESCLESCTLPRSWVCTAPPAAPCPPRMAACSDTSKRVRARGGNRGGAAVVPLRDQWCWP